MKNSPPRPDEDSREPQPQKGEARESVSAQGQWGLEGDADYEVVQVPAGDADPDWDQQEDSILVPNTLPNYRKPVAAIHSLPVNRDAKLKLSARKLLEAMPLAVQLDLRSRRKSDAQELVRKIREERAAPLFEIRTSDLCRMAGIDASNLERIHDTLAEMVGFKFIWNVVGEDGSVEYESVAPLLIRRDKGVGTKFGYTRFAFEPEILLWFLEPKMWANLSWTVLSGLGRSPGLGQEAAFGLYQNVWRYIGTASQKTPARDVATWADLILGPSQFVVVDAKGKKQMVNYKDFKRRHLMPGLELLNKHPALSHTVALSEETQGRKVVRLRFIFEEKKQATFEFPLGWPAHTLKKLSEYGFSDQEISNLSQLYPYAQVEEALKRFPEAERRHVAKGSKVFSKKGFFNGILGNIARGEEEDAEAEAKKFHEAQQLQLREDANKRMSQLREKFDAHRREIVTAAIRGLPDEARDVLIQEHLAARPDDKRLYQPGTLSAVYLTLLGKWVSQAKPDVYADWLPEPQDQRFEDWLAWQVTQPPASQE